MSISKRTISVILTFSVMLLANNLSIAAIPTNGLVSYWQADNNTMDSADGNHGQLMNGASYGPGYDGQAFVFDGVDDYVRIGSPDNLAFTDNFTLTAWIHPTGDGATVEGGIVINKEWSYEFARFQNGRLYWAFLTVDPDNPTQPGDPAWGWVDTGIEIPLNKWSHVAITFSNGTVKSYLNGVLQHEYRGAGARLDSRRYTLDEFRIGGRQLNGGMQYFEGLIDEIAVFNRVLSDQEINQIVNPVRDNTSSVPTTSFWGLLILASLLTGIVFYRQKSNC